MLAHVIHLEGPRIAYYFGILKKKKALTSLESLPKVYSAKVYGILEFHIFVPTDVSFPNTTKN